MSRGRSNDAPPEWVGGPDRARLARFGGPVAAGIAAALLASTAPLHAMSWYEQQRDPSPRYVRAKRVQEPPPRVRSKVKRETPRRDATRKEPVKIPEGPLHIVVSIADQRVAVYSNGVQVAHSVVSTGIPGHATPTGIFSIIQKHRFHRSNIYSGAPMPYMQRITWSGVALHQGVVPGRPASHGCIRLTNEFAARLWGMTKIGARVIVARHQVAPFEIAHPRLLAPKLKAPEMPLVMAPSAASGLTVDRIRSSIDPDKSPGVIRTADATLTVTDATKSSDTPRRNAEGASAMAPFEPAPAPPAVSDIVKLIDSATDVAVRSMAAAKDSAKSAMTSRADDPPKTTAAIPQPVPATPVAATRSEPVKSAETAKPVEPTSEPAKPVEQAAPKVEPPRKPKPITVFVSRKLGKLFVRHGFEPLFDSPVTIAPPEAPLGTHLFTAMELKNEGTNMRWVAVSMPDAGPKGSERKAEVQESPSKNKKHRRGEPEAKKPAPSSAAAASALERIEIPQEALGRITELLIPGSSLIISDQGISGETGKETDFIVLTR